MIEYRRLQVIDGPGVVFVRFKDRKIIGEEIVRDIGDELASLEDSLEGKMVVLSFAGVEFLSNASLNKLILFERLTKRKRASLRLCDLQVEIQEVFVITGLKQRFNIFCTETDALAYQSVQ